MASVVYGLCALTALACAFLLLRAYRRTRNQLLFWSGLCFCGLMVSNVLLILDKLVIPDLDLRPPRLLVTAASMGLLLYGLVYRSE
ncbi:DUF5985 family protein [Tahibacter harae]|uniref:DUF5985 family protein n=1 Tax=Tahibacter harae TaxID=2963937 RepID=A0ABT1QN03_9GAMM|nr:DUF5985 family protein [Tahibacter harae]MCQ4163914.1 DUF5985 family protein [Tahibacter harae]